MSEIQDWLKRVILSSGIFAVGLYFLFYLFKDSVDVLVVSYIAGAIAGMEMRRVIKESG